MIINPIDKYFEGYIHSFPWKKLACCILLTHSKNVTTSTILVLPPKFVFFDEFHLNFYFGRLIRFILNLAMNEMNHLQFLPSKMTLPVVNTRVMTINERPPKDNNFSMKWNTTEIMITRNGDNYFLYRPACFKTHVVNIKMPVC